MQHVSATLLAMPVLNGATFSAAAPFIADAQGYVISSSRPQPSQACVVWKNSNTVEDHDFRSKICWNASLAHTRMFATDCRSRSLGSAIFCYANASRSIRSSHSYRFPAPAAAERTSSTLAVSDLQTSSSIAYPSNHRKARWHLRSGTKF